MARDNASSRGEDRLIPGIFNYCDAWCERCEFRDRCRNYAFRMELEGSPSGTTPGSGLHPMQGDAADAMDMLMEQAEEFGFEPSDFEELDPEELRRFEEEQHREVEDARKHPLDKVTMQYLDLAGRWLEGNSERLDRTIRHMQGQTATHIDGSRLADAREVAQWYMAMIHVKSHRALLGRCDMGARFWENEVQNDANGSAKVALLGAEASLGAWATMAELLSDERREFLPIIATLYRTARLLQKTFPDVRRFVRPGFDDGSRP